MNTTQSETLEGLTTRTVTFIDKAQDIRLGAVCIRKPAGTRVYVTARRGGFLIRVPGTLLEQDVNLASVEPF